MDQKSGIKQEPLVSVLMNCYNGEKYLRQAIESVFAQTYQNWEIIFWDNQSTDHSAEIFKGYKDQRLKYFYAPKHTWLYEARNYAIEKTNGEFIAFLDVDDWWLPNKLKIQMPLFSDPEVGLVCGNHWYESKLKNKRWKRFTGHIPKGWVLNDLLKNYFVGLLTLVTRRSALNSLKYPCDPRFHIIGDFDLVIRLSNHWKLDYVQDPVAFCRLHDGNETAKHHNRHIDELECWWREMSEVESVRSCQNFYFVRSYIIYLKAMNELLQANKWKSFPLFHQLPWGMLKIKLFVGLLLPTSVFRKLKK